ncbi:MAG: ATPase, T2SS/T4P/T4SS family, partial [Halobaculum sp.]
MFREYLPGLDSPERGQSCACTVSFETPAVTDARVTLVVDASDCPDDGDLAAAEGCRATVVDALTERDADIVRTTSDGRTRTYAGRAAALLLAAGRFAERVSAHDEPLAARARRDPLGAARAATGRAGPVARVAAETGLAVCAADSDGYAEVLAPAVAPAVALGRVVPDSDASGSDDRWTLDSGAVVRRYERASGYDSLRLTPVSASLSPAARRALVAARARLATGEVEGGERAPWRAVAAVVGDRSLPVERLAEILHRHTRGCGFLADLLAVPGVTDLSLTAPVAETPIRAEWRGERVETNVRFSRADAETLASRVRAESGRGLSRAEPTADTTLDGVRVAAATDPASDGPAFAFRQDRDERAWTLARLISVGTLPPRAAALARLAVERGAAGLIAGPRGSGKTTLLGALLWEIPRTNRVVVVEDTPELPVERLQSHGRDVQRFAVESSPEATFSPTDAVRTALRFGDGALVVGEVRGAEAKALYEAMRVGAASDTVL